MGRISGLFGVKGWVKIHSYTEPRENVVGFAEWIVEHEGVERRVEVEAGRTAGKHVIAKLKGVDDRDDARRWIGAELAVERAALPPCGPGEYYWVDLEGLTVRNVRGETLGEVDHMMQTGANDVLVLTGGADRLIPWVPSVVREVDVGGGYIVVDWEESFWEP
ncbi:MAG TPA: ribosome maturation factor RimM [Gammaproteobacteria bacterium]